MTVADRLPRLEREMRQEVAAELRSIRRANDWSQEELASLAGVSPSTVAKIEQLRISPRLDTLVRLLAAGNRTLSLHGLRLQTAEEIGTTLPPVQTPTPSFTSFTPSPWAKL